MASSTTAADAGYIARGAAGVIGQHTTKRKYSLSDIIVWQDRQWNIFDNILRQELKIVTVDDPEPKLFTKQEAPVQFSCHSDGTTTTVDEDTLRMSNTQATWLQEGDILTCNQIFCDSDGANYSTTKYDSGYTPETMIVQSVDLSGVAAGLANVIVRRGNGNQPTSSVTTVLTDYKLILQGNCQEDGWTSPTAIYQQPESIQNYVQNFSKTWAENEIETNTNVYAKESMADKAMRTRKEFFREVEGGLLFGRKGKETISGQSRRRTGGIVEYIPGASTALDGVSRFMDFNGAFDLDTFREKMEIAFRYGSQEKTAFCGGKFFTVLYNALEKFITANDGLSKKWGWKVFTLETGHGLLHLMRHPLLSDFDTSGQAWAFDMIGVDLNYVDLMVMKNMDVQIKNNVQDNDVHKEKNELYGSLGLKRSHPSSHFVIHGITG